MTSKKIAQNGAGSNIAGKAAELRSGPAPDKADVFVTIVTSTKPLSKTYTVGPDGCPVKAKEAGLSRGKATRVHLTGTPSALAEQLAKRLAGIQANQAIIPAPPPAGQDEWPLVLAEETKSRPDAVARTKHFFQPVAGPALLGLDFDGKTYPFEIMEKLRACGGLSKALASVFPGLGTAASVQRASVSVGIRNTATNKQTDPNGGRHRYVFVLDGTDIPDFARRLEGHLMLAGWAWGEVSESGAVLYRTLIDVGASADPSRLFYEADAQLEDDRLEHAPNARAPKVEPGGFLNTRALPPLTEAEVKALDEIKLAILDRLEPARRAKRKTYQERRAQELIARGVAPDVANRSLSAAIEHHELEGAFPIHLDDGGVVEVREILAGGSAYHGKTCADPLEPEYGGGRNKAIIYADAHPVRVHSLAHGGIEYRLFPAVEDFFQPITAEEEAKLDAEIRAAEAATVATGDWSEPLDIFGDGDVLALSDVPTNALPPVLERFARDVAERMGASMAFVAGGALAVLSAAIGGGIRIQPKAFDTGWREAPFFWVVSIAPPGAKKSPALSEVVAPLRRLDIQRIEEDARKLAAWDEAQRANRRKPEKSETPTAGPRPRLRRAIVENATVEALANILADNPKGVLWIADEWAGMIGGLGQYKQGGGSDRAEILKLMNGGENVFDRATSGVRIIRCWGAAIIGAVQPDKLAEMIRKNGMAADGLVQRFVFIVGDNLRNPGVDRAPDKAAMDAYSDLITGLAQMPAEFPAVVTLTPEAQEVRQDFDHQIERLKDLPDLSEAWAGHLNKWPGLFVRVLLAFHIAENWHEHHGGAINMPVSGGTAERALRFARYLLRHSLRVYEEYIGLGEAAEPARKAAGAILVSDRAPMLTRTAIYRKVRDWEPVNKRPHPELMTAMRVLERHFWCRPAEYADDGTGPTKWAINPSVYDRFRARSEAEAARRAEARAMIEAARLEKRKLKEEAGQ